MPFDRFLFRSRVYLFFILPANAAIVKDFAKKPPEQSVPFPKMQPPAQKCAGGIPSRSVSRVLSCTVIYLAPWSPMGSSDINETAKRAALKAVSQSCIGRGLHGFLRRRRNGELLPRLSTLTNKSLRYISVALSLKSPPQGFLLRPAL